MSDYEYVYALEEENARLRRALSDLKEEAQKSIDWHTATGMRTASNTSIFHSPTVANSVLRLLSDSGLEDLNEGYAALMAEKHEDEKRAIRLEREACALLADRYGVYAACEIRGRTPGTLHELDAEAARRE